MTGTRTVRDLGSRGFVRVAPVVAILLAAAAAQAAPPIMTPSVVTCVARSGNTISSLMVKPETGWSSVRVYFRRAGVPDFYYLEMRSDGRGSYWATLPRPNEATKAAEVQFSVKDVEGAETRSVLQRMDVTATCPAVLSTDQERFARNLVVGETVTAQSGQMLDGWDCAGVVSRINVDGQLRPDSTCRAAMIAQAANERDKVLVPIAILGGGVVGGVIVHKREHEEESKPRP